MAARQTGGGSVNDFDLIRPNVVQGANGLHYVSIRGVLDVLRATQERDLSPDEVATELLRYAQGEKR